VVDDITVDMSGRSTCDLRCTSASNHGTYCARFPNCIAGDVHRAQEPPDDHHAVLTLTREEKGRSRQGGYNQNRILENPEDGTTIEAVELHCRTLPFEALLRTPAKPTTRN
jgi:hypothetical protein